MTRPPVALSLLLVLALALGFAACGGGDDEASSSTDVNELLQQTFTGKKEVNSGNLDLSLRIEAQGGQAGVSGPIVVRLSGPFQSQEDGRLPEFSLDASFEGGGQTYNAGATSTGDKGFLSFMGTDYAVDQMIFEQFKAGFEQAQQEGQQQDMQSFSSLGMDPRKWLTNPKNEGEAEVGDEDTIKITGGVDVAALMDDVNNALEKASSLGLSQAGQVPERITDAQKQQVVEAVKDPRVEIYTGAEDKILRRMVVNLGIADQAASGTVAFDVSITDLNEDQDIAEPADAKPFQQLMDQLEGLGLGGLGGLGGGAAAPGSGSGGSGSGSGGAGSGDAFEEFSQCIEDAGNDTAKARECADLLSG
jgi:hypothetical protein